MSRKKTTSKRRKPTKDAVAILHRRYFDESAKKLALLEEERSNAVVARQIYDLREEAGLSQRELAKLVGTTASVICRLENADYEGHSLAMLRRIAAALNKRVEIRFVPMRREPQPV
ncbi:MAG TPA: XRE family transcriptional regulator [Thermoguttaceae bacterium]